MNDEIVHADKELRRRAIFVLLILATIGALIVLLTQDYLRDLEALAENNREEAVSKLITLTYVVCLFFVAGILAVFGYFMWLGVKIIRTNCYPPPGMRVIKDTKIVRGTRARLRGAFLITAAVIILLAGSVAVVVILRLMSGLIK